MTSPMASISDDDWSRASTSVKEAALFLEAVAALLVEKNAKYGDSAASPIRIFSRSDPVEQIKVRIDDKLSRLKTVGPLEDEDTIMDLVGYLALLRGVQSGREKSQNE